MTGSTAPSKTLRAATSPHSLDPRERCTKDPRREEVPEFNEAFPKKKVEISRKNRRARTPEGRRLEGNSPSTVRSQRETPSLSGGVTAQQRGVGGTGDRKE